MNQPTRAGYDVFISGETIDLVIPNRAAVERDGWYRWFNDPEVTRYTDHGLWPNTPEKQYAYLESVTSAQSNRVVLLILPKESDCAIGVISLSNINQQHRWAQIGMIIGRTQRSAGALFHGLEAKARVAEHAFAVVGLERIWGTQARPLAEWQRYQYLFGFQVEGIMRSAFRRGHEVHDLVVTSCLVSDYLRVKAARGEYWPGKARLHELMRAVPAENPIDAISAAIETTNADYFGKLGLGKGR
ncbi:MAG: GNAT family N-acetyltransferase [Pseudorhodoplanes sp.]|nr:MAG: GNAT family N-acetyltransferase [Pseudorhodoplanes sp.]